MVSEDMPPSSHSTFPSRSYERILLRPAVTISVRRSFFQMYGVAQVVGSSRCCRQISRPVSLSSARMYEFCSLSLTIYSRPSCSTGEDAVPYPQLVSTGGHSLVHKSLPDISRQYVP